MAEDTGRIRLWWQSFVEPNQHRAYFDILKAFVDARTAPDVDVHIEGIDPPSTELHGITEARCARVVVSNAVRADVEGFDAFAIGHFQEGGINDAKAATDMSVTGLGEVSMYYAASLGRKIGLITIAPIYIPWHEDQIKLWGLQDRVVGVGAVTTTPADYMNGFETDDGFDAVRAQFEAQAKPLIEAGADIIIPAGGLPMLMLTRKGPLTFGDVPVFNGVAAQLKWTEMAARLKRSDGLAVSRQSNFAKPGEKAVSLYLES